MKPLRFILFLCAGTVLADTAPTPPTKPQGTQSQAAQPQPIQPKPVETKPLQPPPPKTPAPVVQVPARFLQVRNEIAQIYPNADQLPVIWDDAHDPFRYGYNADDGDGEAGAGGGSDASGSDEKAAAKKPDLDTASLMEAGMDMLGGKKPKKASASDDSGAAMPFVPLTDAELLRRAVAKLRVGGVVTIRGIPRIMVDSTPRKVGDVIAVSVSGKRANVLLTKIGDNTIDFALQGVTGKTPTLEITF